jgi:hypothetical protein
MMFLTGLIGIGATIWLGSLTDWKVAAAVFLMLWMNNVGILNQTRNGQHR